MYQVYRIVNLINDKIYIGRSKDAYNRFKSHEYVANGGRGYQLHQAIRKYGIKNFRLDILTEHNNLEDSVKKEEYFIRVSGSYKSGYNASKGGFGEMRSEESYKKLSNKLKGREFTEEHRTNISKALKGKKYSIKRRMSQCKPLNRPQWNKGKKLTKKQKAKIQGMKRRPSEMVQIDNFCTFFSLKYAAEHLNTRPENLTRWLNGSRKNTSQKTLTKVGQMILAYYRTHLLYIKREVICA